MDMELFYECSPGFSAPRTRRRWPVFFKIIIPDCGHHNYTTIFKEYFDMVGFVPILLSTMIAAFSLFAMKSKVNLFLMRFFRDLSRYKSRKRLYGNEAALMPILMGKEAHLELQTDSSEFGEDFTMTLAQLADMNGSTETTPIYIALDGLIYDVSAARELYGPGGNYHYFAGKDGSRGFATGCLSKDCETDLSQPLEDEEKEQLRKWIELYHTHDKYKFVGKLVQDPVDIIIDADSADEGTVSEG